MATEVRCNFMNHFNIHITSGREATRLLNIFPVLSTFSGVMIYVNIIMVTVRGWWCLQFFHHSECYGSWDITVCKASNLVLSCNLFGYKLPIAIFWITWIGPRGRWRPPGSMRVTGWGPAGDAPTIFTGRADRSGGVCGEVGYWHSFDSSI